MGASLAVARTVKGWRRSEASLALFIGFVLCSAAPLVPAAHAAETNARHDRTPSAAAIRTALQNRLSAGLAASSETRKQEQAALLDYYAAPDSRLLWVDGKGLNRRAQDVIEEIAKADDYGLRSSDYALPMPGSESLDANRLADSEIEISLAVMRYASDARGGRIVPPRLSANLDPAPALPKPLEVMESIAIRSDPAAYLRSFQPQQPEFEALRKALIAARGRDAGANVRIPDGPLLQLGVEHEQVALLRKRLQVPTENKAYETLFDAALADAVKRFKASHGALPDGIVGPDTRRLLNQPRQSAASPERVRLILTNMERWRWLPNDLGSSYLMVNVPEFTLEVMRDGKRVHAARVVVGEPDYQTPVFSSEIEEIVFNPSWTVPDAIKTGEILPHILDGAASRGAGGFDTSVLEANNLHVSAGGREIDPSAIDWAQVDMRSLTLYQPPGPDNVQGSVKFVFADKHDISMHDTPHKSMFAEPVRAESFGTIRVQGADRLALLLLQQDQGWTGSRVSSAIQNGYDQHVALREAIPAYVTYFTLRVNDDGSTTTFADIYGHDARLAAALADSEPIAERATEGGDAVASREVQATPRRNGRASGNAIAESLSGFLEN
jgi:L,D-transpeptidase YcbB